MLELDGHQVRTIYSELPGLRDAILIALSGYGQESDREQTVTAGFNRHLVKPVSFDALTAAVNSIGNNG